MAFAPGCFAASPGYCGTDTPDPAIARDFSATTLAEVDLGRTTKTEVEALLGRPWRTTFSGNADDRAPLFGSTGARSPDGTYRVHIEFDSRDVTTLTAKILDKAGEAPARVAKPQPGRGKPQK